MGAPKAQAQAQAQAPPVPPLPPEILSAFSRLSTVRSFPGRTVILSEGDQTDSIYIILSGRVKFFLSDASGREIVLGTAGRGEYFGEMVLDVGPRSASVLTLEASTFAVIPMREMRNVLATQPDFAMHLIIKLIRRARTLTENVRSLALMDVYGRVARLLLEVAVEQDGKWIIAERLTQQEIGNRVGASREMIGRILKNLAADGHILIEGGRIRINKKPPVVW